MNEFNFGDWLKKHIEKAGMSQPDFAQKAGIKFFTLREWMRRPRPRISGRNLERLAPALGMSREKLEAMLSSLEPAGGRKAEGGTMTKKKTKSSRIGAGEIGIVRIAGSHVRLRVINYSSGGAASIYLDDESMEALAIAIRHLLERSSSSDSLCVSAVGELL